MAATMIQRMVCAIQETVEISDSGIVNYEDIARAVLMEMRDATEAMDEAGSGFVQSEFAWQAMIDAALKESA